MDNFTINRTKQSFGQGNLTEEDLKKQFNETSYLKVMGALGKNFLLFSKCMGLEWIKYCKWKIFVCCIFPTPWRCVAQLYCHGKFISICAEVAKGNKTAEHLLTTTEFSLLKYGYGRYKRHCK